MEPDPEVTFVGSICRICLQLSFNRYDILQSGLQYLYREFTGINVLPNEGLPAVMCPSCVYFLNKALRFRRKCFETDYYLRDFLSSGQTEFDADTCPIAPYATLHVSETVVCEVVSATYDNDKVESQTVLSEDGNVEYDFMPDFVPDFEPFSVNGINIEPVPKRQYPSSPTIPGDCKKRKRNQTGGRGCRKIEGELLETAVIANMQKEMMEHRSSEEVPLNEEGDPDIQRYFGANLGKNCTVEYKERDSNKPDDTEKVIENLTLDEECLYTMKPQYRKLTKGYKAHDGTVIHTTDLIGPQFLRIEHLNIDQQMAQLEERRNSESYLSRPYKCVSCAISFTLELQYLRHLKRHLVSTGPYQCSICTVRFRQKQGFQRHNYAHRMRFICVICGIKLHSRKVHGEHVMCKHIGLPEILCLLCNKKYKNYQTFRSHNRFYHRGDKHWQCPHCPQRFKKTSSSSFHKHVLKHTGKSLPFACTSCPKSFLQLFQLNKHRALMHEARKLQCENCKAVFPSQFYLDKHVNKGCDKQFNFYRFECDQCPKVFQKQSRLDYHRAMYHTEHTFSCETCGRTFPYEVLLIKHKRRHVPAHCPQCNKDFGRDYVAMRKHLRTHRIKPEKKIKKMKKIIKKAKPKTIVPVGKETVMKKYMPDVRHVTKVLRKEVIKATLVSGCEKHIAHCSEHKLKCVDNFLYKKDRDHFDCDFCNAVFTCQKDLDEHLLNHSDESMYSCRYCESRFEDYASIYVHVRFNHAGESSALYNMCNCIPKASTVSLKPVKITPEKEIICESPAPVLDPDTSVAERPDVNTSQLEPKKDVPSITEHSYYACKYCKSLFKDYASVQVHIRFNHGEAVQHNESSCLSNISTTPDNVTNAAVVLKPYTNKQQKTANIIIEQSIDDSKNLVTRQEKEGSAAGESLKNNTDSIDLRKSQANDSGKDLLTKELHPVYFESAPSTIIAKAPAKKNIPSIRLNVGQTLKVLDKVNLNSKIVLENALRPDLLSEEDRKKLNCLINKINVSKLKRTVMIMKVDDKLKGFTLKTGAKENLEGEGSKDPQKL